MSPAPFFTRVRQCDLNCLITRLIGSLLLALGAVVLLGWVLDIDGLKTVSGGLPSMKVNTALGFILSGWILLLPSASGRNPKFIAVPCALLFLGSVITLIEHTGWRFSGFDQWLLKDQDSLLFPGRPSVATASAFLLLALSFMFSCGIKVVPRVILELTLSLGAAIALTGVLTYLYRPADLMATPHFSSMAVHTAVGLLLAFYAASIGRDGPNLHQLLVKGARKGFTQSTLLIPLLLFPLFSGWLFIQVVDDITNMGFFTALFTTILTLVVVHALAWSARVQERWRQDMESLNEERQRAESKMALVWDSAQAAVMLFDEGGRVIEANRGASAMFGWRIDELLRMKLEDFIPQRMHQRHRLFFAGFEHSDEGLHRNLDDPRRFVAVTRDGREIPFIATVTKQKVGGKLLFGAVLIPADQLASKIEQLQQEVRTDRLTKTENRHSLDKRIQEIENFGFRQSVGKLGCIMLDIDHFKQVNDSYGHDVGDKVLAEFGRRLHACLREGDKLYRYGGEEFVALINCSGYQEAASVAERIQVMMRRSPFVVADIELDIRCSIGVAIVGHDSRSITQCIKFADEALYKAKRSGRDQYVLYQRGVQSAG